jgi:hypothetical protein
MGAGAAVHSGTEQQNYPRELNRDKYESGRIPNSQRTANMRSVRAMALINHSRHENSYISPEEMSLHLAAGKSHSRREDIEYPPDYKHHEMKKVSHMPATISEIQNEAASEKNPPQGLSALRSQFNLKLQLDEDPQEWGQVNLYYIVNLLLFFTSFDQLSFRHLMMNMIQTQI